MTEDMNTAVEETVAESQEAHTNQGDDKEQNFKALREQVSNYQRENDQLQSRLMELERAYQNQPVQQAAPSDDEDLMTKGELKKMLAEKEMIINQQLRSTQLKSQFSDYDQVVNKEVFDEIKRDHPEIGQAIMNSRDPDLLAYVIGKNSDAYRKRTASKQQQQADALKVMENSQKPGSITQASTGGGALSNANYYESMTPDQFEQHVAKVKRRHNWMDD